MATLFEVLGRLAMNYSRFLFLYYIREIMDIFFVAVFSYEKLKMSSLASMSKEQVVSFRFLLASQIFRTPLFLF
jgi:hypothetical protein